MGPRISEKHQTLGVYVAPALPLAFADPGRIRQIIANLLTNAHMYTEEGGRIHVGVEADRAWVKIVVADSGVGHDRGGARAHLRSLLPGPRSRRNGSRAPASGCRSSSRWSICTTARSKCESEPGQGTTFHVFIPAAVTGQTSESLEVIRGRKVLIVDDEREIAELIRGQLAPLEVSATIATSGDAGDGATCAPSASTRSRSTS